jgi:hypothetical protein
MSKTFLEVFFSAKPLLSCKLELIVRSRTDNRLKQNAMS